MAGYITTRYPGVRYREHPTRRQRNSRQPDRYYTIRYRRDDKRIEERIGWASEGWSPERAYNILAEIKGNITTGRGPQSLKEMRADEKASRASEIHGEKLAEIERMTLGDFLTNHYLPNAEKSKRSWKTDGFRIRKHILPAIGTVPLRSLTGYDTQQFFDRLRAENDLSPASIRHIMALLRYAYNMAAKVRVDGVPLFSGDNPAVGLDLPRVINARDRYLSHEEATALIAAASKLSNPDTHDAIILALHAGLRLGEIQRLRWSDYDLTAGILTIRETDRRKPGGKIPVSASVRQMLATRRNRLASVEDALVFPPPKQGTRTYYFVTVYALLVEQLSFNAGIDPGDRQHRVVFHTLRHTFASWLALLGTDIYRIKTLMRHRTITMTMRYAHLIPDATRDAIDHLPLLINSD